ncbi:hypothetical protein QWZ06_01215 [Chryseobacterium tructae]|uniref:Uncharacterized protein n=1 Tax=Chryseobacterium tructae TaxID=1037380 RepID=A0ABV7XTZ4_9FLAO|nr:hypothetical protein [Chryseobacterium tructae]MDN3690983.1 hypothetical protein [Chryseobacterium tructae]
MTTKPFLFIVLFSFNLFFSQKYILLDDVKLRFPVHEYTLDTHELYDIKKDINVYNVFVSKNTILLITVLPDLSEKVLPGMDERGNNWQRIDIQNIKDKIVSNDQMINIATDWKVNNTPEKKTLEYQLVKKEKDAYYTSKMSLTELFSIEDLKFPLLSSYGTINTTERKVTIKEMETSFKTQFPKQDFIMDITGNNKIRSLDERYSFRNYLSKEYIIKGNKAYQFWTFDGWWEHDGYNESRGIDRFLYIPDKGIVGGSYDFYFRKNSGTSSTNTSFTVSDFKLWGNIINERIMTAKELK